MCRGPHEWSTQELEEHILHIRQMLDSKGLPKHLVRIYEGRLEQMEKLLKERAEEGTY